MNNTARILATLVALTFFLIPAFAQDEAVTQPDHNTPEVAWVTVNETLVSWEPTQNFEAVTLRVTGSQGLVFSREFPAGSGIVFDLTDDFGNPLPDGGYTWEVTGTPRIAGWVRDEMTLARETGTDEALATELRASGDLPTDRFTQSGFLTVKDGVALLPEMPEPAFGGDSGWKTRGKSSGDKYSAAATPMDIVHLDDVIIDGSLCVGFDCVNGESFGFDTLRLKENNLRLHFQDTSNSASFPTRDWRIVANDSSNGGASYLAFEDSDNARQTFRVFHGAPANALTVDANGDVGLGTANAVVELHVVDGDTPTLRLEQDGSSGFTPQTWDVAGNETNYFVRDVTGGSLLPFRIRQGAPTSSIDIANNGDIGIGSTSPSPADVKIARSGDIRIDFDDTAGTNADWTIGTVAATNVFRWSASGTGGNEMTIGSAGDITFNQGATNNMTLQGSTGNVTFRGSVSAASKPFKIDHPLDPANKYLYHTAVESPDMANFYNGNIVLNAQGEAWIELPEWFEALNKDYRYQLTPIGAPAPDLFVASQISGNRFKISGGPPGTLVSWQVTGVRQDAWANAYRTGVEEDKPATLRGTYIHPELFENQLKRAEGAAPSEIKSGKED